MNKKVLIVAATNLEIKPFLEHHLISPKKFIQSKNFDILITGVGAWATTFAIGKYAVQDYGLILNVGIAGSFDKNLALGDLCLVIHDTFSDFGAESPGEFLNAEMLGLGKIHYKSNFNSPLALNLDSLIKSTAITSPFAHGTELSIAEIQKRFPAKLESMEGAAVFYAASELNIPAIQIRSISNYVEPRNRDSWEINKAIQNLNTWLINYSLALNEF